MVLRPSGLWTVSAVVSALLIFCTACNDTGTADDPPAPDHPSPSSVDAAAGSSGCTIEDGIRIETQDDAQDVVTAQDPGTTFIVAAGVHRRNFTVTPQVGDKFCGEPGAILDGGGDLAHAFHGDATNVTLDSITVQNYNAGWQGGAINPSTHASGWTVRNVTASRNHWAGLRAADDMRILGGHYNDNGQLGIGGNSATGIVLDGLDDDPATLDGPEMARNQSLRTECDYEGGGMKWDKGQVTIRNVHVHDNECIGLWADINARDALIENSLVEDNGWEGIYYEISQDAIIRNNQVYGNGRDGRVGWYWAGGITVASSFNVEVYGNRLSGNYNGITGTQQTRLDATPPAHRLDNYHVHDNVICDTVGPYPTGSVADNGANLDLRDIVFADNTVRVGSCRP